MPPFRVLVLDLDGTVLASGKGIPAAVRDAVHAFRYGGGHVLVATARRVGTALPYVRQLRADLPFVAENGARIVHPDGTIFQTHPLPRAFWERFLEMEIPFVATIQDENFIFATESWDWRDYQGYPGTHEVRTPRDLRNLPSPSRLVVPQGVVLPRNGIHVYAQPDGTLHIAPEGVSKREGVLRVLRLYGFSPRQCLFMGDGGVDFPLFLEIPWSAAPRDALPYLLHYARCEMPPADRAGAALLLRSLGVAWKSP